MTSQQPVYLSDAIGQYLDECAKYKHLAASTLKRYRITLNHFSRQLPAPASDAYQRDYVPGSGPAVYWSTVTMDSVPVDAWREYVASFEHQSNKSYNCHLSHVSAFVRWCYDQGYLSAADKHLRGLREKPNTVARAKTYVTAEQLPAVLDAGERWHPRDRYFMDALWHSWRRSGELAAVRVCDVDLEPYPDSPHGRMTWHNIKAHRPNQCLDMSPGLNKCLREWLAVYAELAGETPKPSWMLFPALTSTGLTVAGKRRRLVLVPERQLSQPDAIARRAFKAAGIYTLGMACHAFRRGAATQLYDDMANAGHKNPLRLAMTALDHRSEQQTESYLNKDRDRRDLAAMLDQVYGDGAESGSPAEPEQAIETPAEPASTVVSLAAFKAAKAV